MDRFYDERETMFSRARLKKGTRRYADFYKAHPELKKRDDEVRGMDFMDAIRKSDAFKERFIPLFKHDEAFMKSLYDFLDSIPMPKKKTALPTDFHTNIKAIAKHYGAEDVGIVKLNKHHYYTHFGGVNEPLGIDLYGEKTPKHYTHAIVFLKTMRKDYINRAPHFEELSEALNVYTEVAITGSRLATYIKSLGYETTFMSEIYYLAPLVPLAYDAGLGEIGMSNHIVHPVHGDRIRLGAVFTTLPLKTDTPIDFGLRAFCKRCALCLMNCPMQSIKPQEREVNGRIFYQFDEPSCFRMFRNMGTDCGVCIQSCPYSQGIPEKTQAWMRNDKDRIDAYLKDYLKDKRGRRVSIKTPLDIVKGGDDDDHGS
ncbi:MAG: 4Fe-4S dicluster domain-containing protein [Bacillota bacterium]